MSLINHDITLFNNSNDLKNMSYLCYNQTKFNFDKKIIKNISKYLIWHTIKIGDRCDAKDSYNTWYNATVINCDGEYNYLIHYDSWNPEFNEWVDIRDKRILPLYSKVSNWKELIQIDDTVEYKYTFKNEDGFKINRWTLARVTKIKKNDEDEKIKQCKLFYIIKDITMKNICVSHYININSEKISKLNTHISLENYSNSISEFDNDYKEYTDSKNKI